MIPVVTHIPIPGGKLGSQELTKLGAKRGVFGRIEKQHWSTSAKVGRSIPGDPAHKVEPDRKKSSQKAPNGPERNLELAVIVGDKRKGEGKHHSRGCVPRGVVGYHPGLPDGRRCCW